MGTGWCDSFGAAQTAKFIRNQRQKIGVQLETAKFIGTQLQKLGVQVKTAKFTAVQGRINGDQL